MTAQIRILQIGREMYSFSCVNAWNEMRSEMDNRLSGEDIIILDRDGRACTDPSHITRAFDEGAYPIKVYKLTI